MADKVYVLNGDETSKIVCEQAVASYASSHGIVYKFDNMIGCSLCPGPLIRETCYVWAPGTPLNGCTDWVKSYKSKYGMELYLRSYQSGYKYDSLKVINPNASLRPIFGTFYICGDQVQYTTTDYWYLDLCEYYYES